MEKKEKVAISERLLLRQFYPPSFFYPALRFFTPQNYKGAGENNKGGKNGDLPRAAERGNSARNLLRGLG